MTTVHDCRASTRPDLTLSVRSIDIFVRLLSRAGEVSVVRSWLFSDICYCAKDLGDITTAPLSSMKHHLPWIMVLMVLIDLSIRFEIFNEVKKKKKVKVGRMNGSGCRDSELTTAMGQLIHLTRK